jgi:hypothetical protein
MYKIEYQKGDIVGDYGVIFIEELPSHRYPNGKPARVAKFKCPYDGNVFETNIEHIKRNIIKSCGCYRSRFSVNAKHGMYKTRLYKRWLSIKRRCFNKYEKSFKNYGGRGITLYKEWVSDFPKFREYILSIGWEEDTNKDIDRIDNDGNYEPNNLRLVSRSINAQNTRLLNIKNTSGYRGVSYCTKRKKWIARSRMEGLNKYIGSFTFKLEAAVARDLFVINNKLYSPLNFPPNSITEWKKEINV